MDEQREKQRLHRAIDTTLSSLKGDPWLAQRVLTSAKEEGKVKKKLSIGLVLVIVLVMAAVTVLAAYVLTRSEESNAISRARHALSEAYGLTPATMGMFNPSATQDGGVWTVVLTADGYWPFVGDYTVVLTGDDARASWSNDNFETYLWEDGDLSAPVWGQPQLEKVLRDPEAATTAYLALNPPPLSLRKESGPPDAPTPEEMAALGEGESWWKGQIVRDATPGAEDMTQEAALEIAYQALMEDFGLTREQLEAGVVREVNFHTRDEGNPLWGFSILPDVDGVRWDCGVVLDARTGEVLLTNIITGANE